MFRTICSRVAIPYIMLTLVTIIGLMVYLSVSSRQAYIDNARSQLMDETLLIADLAEPFFGRADAQNELGALAHRYAHLLGIRVTILSSDGSVLGESHPDETPQSNYLDRPEIRDALIDGQGFSIRYSETLRQQMIYVARSIVRDGQVIGFVRLSLPLSNIGAHVNELNRTLAGATLGALALIVILAVLITERTVQPLRQLIGAVERMAKGDLSVRILSSTKDEVSRLASAFNDMAVELQRQMNALVDQRNTLAAVLTHMTDGAVITDADGHVQLMNPAAARLLGVSADDVHGSSLVTVVRDHQIAEVWQRCQRTGSEQSDFVEIGGRGPFLRVIATPLLEPSRGAILLILQDLTQVRRLETVRRDFISNISHELRNPLAALKALVETLRDGALDDRPMAERFLVQMDAEVDAMTQMVRELLELSRIESGRVPLNLVPTPVPELINPVVERLRPQAQRAGLTITVDLPDDLPLVRADHERLQQVLTNLLHNAIKFTPPGGSITVSAEKGEWVTIAVRDTGIGIAAADLPRIFERFYKADRARSGGGTGLGLAIAKHIVQAHGGKIWAESIEGQGATFRFTLRPA